jgi:hypothetical protein
VFAVIAELDLLVFVAECIGQLKWVHYDDLWSKLISFILVFDDDSRWPMGITCVILRGKEIFNSRRVTTSLGLTRSSHYDSFAFFKHSVSRSLDSLLTELFHVNSRRKVVDRYRVLIYRADPGA